MRAHHAGRLKGTRRPRHLLSGLLVCSVCGGNYAILLNDRYGCTNRYRRKCCSNGHTVRREEIESRVLAGLKDKPITPAAAADAIRSFQRETDRLNHERRAAADVDRRAVEAATRKIKEIVGIIEDGGCRPALLERLDDLERQKSEAEVRLKDQAEDLPDVNPNIAEVYRVKIARLAQALADPEAGLEAAEHIRSLVGQVVLTPGKKRGEVHAALHGELGAILELVARKNKSPTPGMGVRLSVVAGARSRGRPNSLVVAV